MESIILMQHETVFEFLLNDQKYQNSFLNSPCLYMYSLLCIYTCIFFFASLPLTDPLSIKLKFATQEIPL